jgi:uncharacterized protein (TIGR03435 family)
MIGELTNHLWQSTLFVLAAALVAAALRGNGAHIRHAVWVVASVKFLVPFALLMSVGGSLAVLTPAVTQVIPATAPAPDFSIAVDRIAQPFTSDVFSSAPSTATPPATNRTTLALIAVWACGFVAVVLMRLRGWRRIRAAMRASVPMALASPVPVRASPGVLEPGVVGVWRPVLLVPAGIEQHLPPPQLHAVLEHELCHVRRRDNLTSAIHMVVEAVCWFHPLVWWVGARLVDERERACDEHVLRVCGAPQTYAESILNVCKLYVESPLACVSGVTGSDLKRRITAIMGNRVGLELTVARRLILAICGALAVGAPLVAGSITAPSQATLPRFEVVSIKPCDGPRAQAAPAPRPGGGRGGGAAWAPQVSPGYVYIDCITLADLIDLAYSSDDQPLLNTVFQRPDSVAGPSMQSRRVRGGPRWVTSDLFTIEGTGPLDLTTEALVGRQSRLLASLPAPLGKALRAAMEDRFQLKLSRATEQQDMYALTVAAGGLNSARVTSPVPGDCLTVEEYSASPAANASLEEKLNGELPGICGRVRNMVFSRFTFGQLAKYLSTCCQIDYVVADRTGVDGPFNFTLVVGPRAEGTLAERFARALVPLGLRMDLAKGPAEYLLIESVQRLRPNEPF